MLKEFADPELLRLAKKLPSTILRSRAPSLSKKYIRAFRHWKAWAEEHNLTVFPVNEHCVALYLQHLGGSKSAVEDAINALNWVHNLAGVQSPTHSPLVQSRRRPLCRLTYYQRLLKMPRHILVCQTFGWLQPVSWHSPDFCGLMS